jgi:actin-related protein 10
VEKSKKMPFYDGIGVIAEKHAVVLDIGSAYSKVGYAGESSPRAIVRTPLKLSDLDIETLHDTLVSFVHKLYFEILLVNPKDRRVVLVEAILGETRLKDELVKVLFNHFEVLSILLAPSHLMPLFGLGVQNGLVLDVGHDTASVIPVYQSVPILRAWQALPLASKAIQDSIRTEIQLRGTAKQGESQFEKFENFAFEIEENTIEDIKVRLCFITDLTRGQQIQQIRKDGSAVSGLSSFLKKSVPAADYSLSGDTVLKIDGQTRESACEVLFEQDNDLLSVPAMILDALIASPVDTRRDLAKSIIMVGGTTMMLGFKARIFQELECLLKSDHYKDRLKIEELKLHIPLGRPNYACWAGASIFGATDAISTRSFTREVFLKEKAIPDWSNLRFNTAYNDEQRQG